MFKSYEENIKPHCTQPVKGSWSPLHFQNHPLGRNGSTVPLTLNSQRLFRMPWSMESVAAERVNRSKRDEFLCLDPARPESLLKTVPIICLLKDALKLPSYQDLNKEKWRLELHKSYRIALDQISLFQDILMTFRITHTKEVMKFWSLPFQGKSTSNVLLPAPLSAPM